MLRLYQALQSLDERSHALVGAIAPGNCRAVKPGHGIDRDGADCIGGISLRQAQQDEADSVGCAVRTGGLT
ncbi:hypothetical protein D9M68_791700 [compost metagenome]